MTPAWVAVCDVCGRLHDPLALRRAAVLAGGRHARAGHPVRVRATRTRGGGQQR